MTPKEAENTVVSEPVLNQPVSQSALALFDLVEGARLTHLWGRLGWQDIRRRYRRSTLGPFWITISMGMLVGVLGILYGGLFKVDGTDCVPYLTFGFVIWRLVRRTDHRWLHGIRGRQQHHSAGSVAVVGPYLPRGLAQPDHHLPPQRRDLHGRGDRIQGLARMDGSVGDTGYGAGLLERRVGWHAARRVRVPVPTRGLLLGRSTSGVWMNDLEGIDMIPSSGGSTCA